MKPRYYGKSVCSGAVKLGKYIPVGLTRDLQQRNAHILSNGAFYVFPQVREQPITSWNGQCEQTDRGVGLRSQEKKNMPNCSCWPLAHRKDLVTIYIFPSLRWPVLLHYLRAAKTDPIAYHLLRDRRAWIAPLLKTQDRKLNYYLDNTYHIRKVITIFVILNNNTHHAVLTTSGL